MSNIPDTSEAWAGHTGLEVETFIKSQLDSLIDTNDHKFGYVGISGTNIVFYDEEGGTALGSVSLSGDLYSITMTSSLGTSFYVLGGETSKNITISANTKKGTFGSPETTDFPEGYDYTFSVNDGTGYVQKDSGHIGIGEDYTKDIRNYIKVGVNYLRFSFTGDTSGQTKTLICTATVTSLWLTCDHTWQTPWISGNDYVIKGIRFAGSIQKTLHIAVDGTQVGTVDYAPNQSYSVAATTYTIPASAFPSTSSSVHTVSLWMTAQGVSTQTITFNTMCVIDGDTTPIVCINSIVPAAVNFTTSNIFAFAVYNSYYAKFNITANMGSSSYNVVTQRILQATPGTQYPFSVELGIESEEASGTLTAIATALDDEQNDGISNTVTIPVDNTYSYLATPGAVFYMNPGNRSNSESNHELIVNEAIPDSHFSSTYTAEWNGFSWSGDGWNTDLSGYKCLAVPAGCSVTIPELAPLQLINSYQSGLTYELLLQAGYPSDYDTPILSISDATTNEGITIYPTRVVVLGSTVREETLQMANLCENRITHLAITFTKNYSGAGSSFNLCSIYINGTSNCCFSFPGSETFGSSSLKIGAPDVDTYIYKMRIYGEALDSRSILNNFLNCIIDGVEFVRKEVDEKNDLLYGGVVGYDQVKNAGLNTMVVYMGSDNDEIPSYNNNSEFSNCSLRFEYADHPEWDFTLGNVKLDGQGTTSKQYYRWNLRAKTSDSSTWTYDDASMTDTTGKSGYFAGTGNPKVDRITAKKNYASSMQGHKMGLTGLYDDLYTQLGLKSELPNSNANVAVYQYPFVGFRYRESSNSYEYIGLYTAGPDKGSKVTFGYSSDYNYLLSLEGPNHNPLATRFLIPWTDVAYDYQNTTLTFGGQEAWDCDYVGNGLDNDTQASQASVLALYESEWKPAYDFIYNCSPYIESLSTALSEGGYQNVAAANADITNFLKGSTGGVPNNLLSFYDNNYDIWFYRINGNKLDKLTAAEGVSTFNILTYLGLTGTPSTADIKAARAEKFKSDLEDYFSVDQTLYHYCFCVLLGITDNFAKNSYPFKFRGFNESLASGESTQCKRWGWRQDDLDTAFITDNNGRQTKKYSVEPGDKNATGADIFQGYSSALWTLIAENYEDEICEMMANIVNAASSIASNLGITGDGKHGDLFNVISYYCWEKSSKYFPCTLYEEDRFWSYITPWLANPAQEYNNVLPLTQALGDQYQAERLWVERRIAYIFSRYKLGAFAGDVTGMGAIAFTLGEQFTFNVKPAIDLYPVITQGSSDVRAGRTGAGQSSSDMTISPSSDTTVYIHGGDWLSSLGDLHTMKLAVRGGDTGISFSVVAKRLVDLIVGGASGVAFNATLLNVESPTITKIDARNTTTIQNEVSLINCPRLREAHFAGSGATGLILPVGSRVTDVSMPENITTLYLNSLRLLENIDMPSSLANIRSLYINDTPAADATTLLKQIMDTENNKLGYATLIGDFTVDNGEIDCLHELATGDYGRVVYDGNYSVSNDSPDVKGTLNTTETDVSAEDIYDISEAFPELDVQIPKNVQYIHFEDSEAENVIFGQTSWDKDGDGRLTVAEAGAVTNFSTYFKGNKNIRTFNEFKFFTGFDKLDAEAFSGCTSLESVVFPSTMTKIGTRAFYNCNFSGKIVIPDGIQELGWDTSNTYSNCLFGGTYTEFIMPDSVQHAQTSLFHGRTKLEKVRWSPNLLPYRLTDNANNYSGDFDGCTSLTQLIDYPWDKLTGLSFKHFYDCPIDLNENLKQYSGNIRRIMSYAFSRANAHGVWNLTSPEFKINGSYIIGPNGLYNERSSFDIGFYIPHLKAITNNFLYSKISYLRLDSIERIAAGAYRLNVGTLVVLTDSVPTLEETTNGQPNVIFVKPNMVEAFKTTGNWATWANRIGAYHDPSDAEFCSFPQKSSLPEGYTEIEYIANRTANTALDTGYVCGRYAQVLIDANVYYMKSGSCYMFSSNRNGSTHARGVYFNGAGNYSLGYQSNIGATEQGAGLAWMSYDDAIYNNRTTFKFNYRYYEAVGTPAQSHDSIADDDNSLVYFLQYGSSIQKPDNYKMKFYRSTIFEPIDGTTDFDDPANYEVVRDFIPCLNPNGIAGVYETVTGTFIRNTYSTSAVDNFLTPSDF